MKSHVFTNNFMDEYMKIHVLTNNLMDEYMESHGIVITVFSSVLDKIFDFNQKLSVFQRKKPPSFGIKR